MAHRHGVSTMGTRALHTCEERPAAKAEGCGAHAVLYSAGVCGVGTTACIMVSWRLLHWCRRFWGLLKGQHQCLTSTAFLGPGDAGQQLLWKQGFHVSGRHEGAMTASRESGSVL